MKKNSFIYGRFIGLGLTAAIIAFAALLPLPSRLAAFAEPAEVDPLAVEALYRCAEYCRSHDFSTELAGDIEAKALGIKHRQHVTGSRVRRGGEYVDVTESASRLVKAGVKKVLRGGRYYAARGTFCRGGFSYPEPAELAPDDFVASYGRHEPCLFNYELDGAITFARRMGEGEYEYRLDPGLATRYSRNAVRTALGVKSDPDYAEVTLTLKCDGDVPLETTAYEVFTVSKFGKTRCAASYRERFGF